LRQHFYSNAKKYFINIIFYKVLLKFIPFANIALPFAKAAVIYQQNITYSSLPACRQAGLSQLSFAKW